MKSLEVEVQSFSKGSVYVDMIDPGSKSVHNFQHIIRRFNQIQQSLFFKMIDLDMLGASERR